jgi:hypothetical protein
MKFLFDKFIKNGNIGWEMPILWPAIMKLSSHQANAKNTIIYQMYSKSDHNAIIWKTRC